MAGIEVRFPLLEKGPEEENWTKRVIQPLQAPEDDANRNRNSPWMPVEPDMSSRGGREIFPGMHQRDPELVIDDQGAVDWGIQEHEEAKWLMNKVDYSDSVEPMYNSDIVKPLFDPDASKGNWYKYVEEWMDSGDKLVADAEATGISQGASKVGMWAARTFIGEPLRALRTIQEADLSQPPSRTPGFDKTGRAIAETALNVGILSSVAEVPKGALRLFGGRVAAQNLTDQGLGHAEEALNVAKDMVKRGMTEDQIRKATSHIMEKGDLGGVSIGADGKLRFEISDKYSKVQHWDKVQPGEMYNLGMIFKHDTLYKLYPDLGIDVTVAFTKIHPGLRGHKPSASYYPDKRHITVEASNADDARSAILHELQHELQRAERFAPGANSDVVRGSAAEAVIREQMDDMAIRIFQAKGAEKAELIEQAKLKWANPKNPNFETYRRVMGEVEARNVQTRMDMSNKGLRERAPVKDEDIPRDQQISEGDLQLDMVPPGLRRQDTWTSDKAPEGWVPSTKKHLDKEYVLLENGRPVGSASTKDRADKQAAKKGGREDEASTVTTMKTSDYLDAQWNTDSMKRFRENMNRRQDSTPAPDDFTLAEKTAAKSKILAAEKNVENLLKRLDHHERRMARSLPPSMEADLERGRVSILKRLERQREVLEAQYKIWGDAPIETHAKRAIMREERRDRRPKPEKLKVPEQGVPKTLGKVLE